MPEPLDPATIKAIRQQPEIDWAFYNWPPWRDAETELDLIARAMEHHGWIVKERTLITSPDNWIHGYLRSERHDD
jgi:hypothetical protein